MNNDNNNQELPLGLYWKGKRTTVDRIVLPFQSLEAVETINESRATREKEKSGFFKSTPNSEDVEWRNKLIWGDNKYVMSALLEQYAGKIDLIYIDPPFATGANFSTTVEIGDNEIEVTKEASAIEEVAYRDTWGKGLDSFLQMMYDRLVLMRELLSDKGSIYVHVDWRTNSYIRLLLDEVFGYDNFLNEISYCYTGPTNQKNNFPRKHDNIFLYRKGKIWTFNSDEVRIDYKKSNMATGATSLAGRKSEEELLEMDKKGKIVEDFWTDLPDLGKVHSENVGYPTQKAEKLLDRIIKASSNKGDLVADFFCGSGTTAAVAEKLGRRWITSDLGRYSIHTARKRFLEIEDCKPFEILNIGKYERQYWQTIQFGNKTAEQSLAEYIAFVLKLYKAEALPGSAYIHGKKGNKLVHIGGVDAPVTFGDIQHALEDTRRMKQKELVVLGWEWEMGLHDVVEQEAEKAGIKLHLLSIPREAMDKRAVDAGDIQFFELAYLETEVKKSANGYQIKLTDFIIPNLDLIPADVKKLIKKWSDYIDYWSVDWDYKDDTFHNQWQSYRTKKDRSLELITDPKQYDKKGDYKVMVKVIDIFGNDTTHIIELKHR
jgi:adenine-specific DNA-methyltransferase